MTGKKARLRCLLAAASLPWLVGCANLPGVKPPDAAGILAGRLAVSVAASGGIAARSMTAAFELSGSDRAGQFSLASPLGSVLAQARWSADGAVLDTPKGQTRFDDLGALTREMLGEELPVRAWFDWLRGRPWPGATSAPRVSAPEPGFDQLGWTIDLSRFEAARVEARREQSPAVVVRVQLEGP